MLVMIYHFIMVAYKLFVLRVRPSMLPTWGDVTDFWNSLRYYVGLTPTRPKMPRYNFAEKIEYWAVIWGGVLMAVTGFMLWNPIATTNLLPGEFVPAARAAHSAEALLAFLAIIIWHVYWVHLKTFNRAMFTGQLSHAQMEEEHAAELEEIEAGLTPSPPALETRLQRQRIFTPVASVATIVMLIGLYLFVTFEQTAITRFRRQNRLKLLSRLRLPQRPFDPQQPRPPRSRSGRVVSFR
jgi:cytochrome b subunit of formate dehydrogenase